MTIVDGTAGGGGHTEALAKAIGPTGRVIAIDRDPDAIEMLRRRIGGELKNVHFHTDSYRNLAKIIYAEGLHTIDGIVLDLGLSSDQLAASERGFSFAGSGSLDMRFGQEGPTAADIIRESDEDELTRIFKEYGDERHARRIAQILCERRESEPIVSVDQLVLCVTDAYRGKRMPRGIHVATKAFQALRIAVNDEHGAIQSVLPEAINILTPGGRIAVISFHSGEDGIVKRIFKQEAIGCLCPPRAPVCTCDHKPRITVLTKKPITPSDEEVARNPRSRSAKLRVAEKK